QSVVDAAHRLGIDSPLKSNPSLALGTSEVNLLDLTSAYVPFANGGYGVWPYGVRQVTGQSGVLLYRRSGEGPGRVIEAPVQAAMVDLLHASVEWGTSRAAAPGRPAGGKTGTTQDSRDAWFIGFTAELVVGVWMGNDDGTRMQRVTGGGLPARLWNRIVTRSLEGQPVQALPVQAPVPQPAPEQRQALAEEDAGFLDRLIENIAGGGSSSSSSSGSGGDAALERMQEQRRNRNLYGGP